MTIRDGHRRQGIGLALTQAGEEYRRGCGTRRVTPPVAFEDEDASGFWEAAGYPHDEEIGRPVRNL
jgi:hypothetical protein